VPQLDEEEGTDNAVPVRAQLLYAIAQCNAFTARLPLDPEEGDESEDAAAVSHWRSALLYPLLARMASGGERERLFDDPLPLSHVPAFFPCAGLLNHSCSASLSYTSCQWAPGSACPTVRITATRDMGEGEEATLAYGYAGEDAKGVEERRYKLLVTYRFRCACPLCVQEESLAGTPADPLAHHFPRGLGLDGQRAFYDLGGKYPQA
jgi:hypothetical protein